MRMKTEKSNKKTILKILPVIAAAMLICILFTGCGTAFKNDSFEKGSGERIDGWSINNYERSIGDETSGGVTISEDGYSGRCVKISNNVPNDVRVYQKIALKENTYYKVTCMVKIEGEIDEGFSEGNRGAGFNISAIQVYQRTTGLYTTNGEWMEYTAYVQTGKSQKDAELSIGIGGYSAESKGVAYLDEVRITKIDALPEGVGAISILRSDSSSSTEKGQEANIWFKILFVALGVSLAVFVLLVIKKHDDEKYKQQLSVAEDPTRIKKLDIILICSLTLVCAVVSFYKLGNAYGASSYWKPAAGLERVTVEFDSVRNVSRTTVLPNIPSSRTGTYMVMYEETDGSGNFKEAFSFSRSDSDPPEFFEWKLYNNKFTTRRVRVVCTIKGLALNEMAFWEKDADGNYVQLPVTVTGQEYDPEVNTTEFTPANLFDEQDLAEAFRTYENGTYFDEIYFPRTAYEHIYGLPIYETTHPPLGKTLISIGIRIFGMNPFGWRFMGTLMGVLLVPIIYLLALKLLRKSNFAFIAAFLLCFDFMRTAQTRLATIDTYSVFFTMLMYYFMFDYFTGRSYDKPFWKSLLPLFLCGLCFGLGAASKWTSIYSGVGLAILFFVGSLSEAYNSTRGGADGSVAGKEGKKAGSWTLTKFLPTCGCCIIFFILIPVAIYVLSYLPYMASNPDKSLLQVVWENQKYMYNYHSGLNSTHPYQSSWYSWIIDMRPIYYYSSSDAGLASGIRASVASFGNPAVWWVGLGCLPVAVYYTWKRRDKGMLVAFVGYACQLFPWILVTRCTFIYHYFTSVPFLIIMLVYVIKCLWEDKIIGKPTILIYMGIVLALYVFFYPVLVGIPVKNSYISDLRWFNSWSF
jgi:hypothetical protein